MAGALVGTVTGYVAKDPEQKGSGPLSFSVPVSKGKDKPTTWVRVAVWGKTAEYVSQYIRKGSLVTCSGTLELREFEGSKGKITSLEMSANSVTSFKTGESAPAPRPQQTYGDQDDIGF